MSDRTEALENVARAAQRYIRAREAFYREFGGGTSESACRVEGDRDAALAALEDALAAVPTEGPPPKPLRPVATAAEWARHEEQYDDECPVQAGTGNCWCEGFRWT